MNYSNFILVDSSIWIEYFRIGRFDELEVLILENLACTNELILSELIPFALHKNQRGIVEGLHALELVPLNIDWIGIRQIQLLNLKKGIHKVGIPDLIHVQQALEYKFEFWTIDKHFKKMSKFLGLRLFKV